MFTGTVALTELSLNIPLRERVFRALPTSFMAEDRVAAFLDREREELGDITNEFTNGVEYGSGIVLVFFCAIFKIPQCNQTLSFRRGTDRGL